MTIVDPLFLLRLNIDLPRLYQLAQRHFQGGPDDLGYLLHVGLAALFDTMRPKTFVIESSEPRMLRILAYSLHPLTELRTQAETFADPDAFRLCDWETATDKPMPTIWKVGQRLGFQTRICPVVRTAQESEHHRAGAEVDSFLLARLNPESGDVMREEVYAQWVRERFEYSGGALLEEATIQQFHMETLLRRTQGTNRKIPAGLRKPDATLRGTLTLQDSEKFSALLQRGLGRHRAFGFGMILLRPAR